MKLDQFIKISPILTTKPVPWKELDFSSRSLQLHLDQENDVNSRRDFIIEKHVHWIHSTILHKKPSKILDLACGPGLYTSKLAKLNHICTGVDISPLVIKYAADQKMSNCQYFCDDMVNFISNEKFDLILINFGWLNNFSVFDAKKILSNAKKMLNSKGILLLELMYLTAVQDFGENPPQWHKTDNGIFSDEPYIFLQENNWNEKSGETQVFYHIIKTAEDIISYQQNYKGYEKDEICQILENQGFGEFQFFHDICDEDDFDEDLFFLYAQKLK